MKRLYFTLCFLLALSSGAFLQAQTSCLVLKGEHLAANTGSTVCVDISVENFNQMLGMQYGLSWDPAVLTFREVNNLQNLSLSNTNFGYPEVTGYADRITFFWVPNDNVAQDLPDDAVLFSLCLQVVGETGTASPIEFTTTPTPLEFLSASGNSFELQPASLYDGSITVGNIAADLPAIISTSCPQANGCSEVAPVGIETSVSGGTPPYAYTWTGPDAYSSNSANITDIAPGSYHLEVSDAAGLFNSALFYAPSSSPISVTGINITHLDGCDQETGGAISMEVNGGSGSYSFLWSDGAETQNRSDLTAGVYDLTITDLLLGCSEYRHFTVDNGSKVQVKSTQVTDVSCGSTNTGAITITLEGDIAGASVVWSTGDTGTTIENLAVGGYLATITDASGCSQELFAAVAESGSIEFAGTIGYVNCLENSGFINLEVAGDSADYTYAWSTGATTKDISGLGFGSYRVTITNPTTGCSGYANFPVKDEEFLTGSTYECTIVDEQTVFAKVSTIVWGGGTPPYTFNWSNGDSMVDDLIGFTTVSLPATITVTITDSKGCVTIADPITPDCTAGSNTEFSTASSYNCVVDENGESTQAEITYTVWEGGLPPYTFDWSTGESFTDTKESTIIAPADGLTSYRVTVTDQAGKTYVSNPITPLCQIDGTPLTLDLGNAAALPGDAVCLPVTVQDFNNIAALQFSLSWDPSQLVGDSITNINLPNFDDHEYSFGPFTPTGLTNDALTVAWINNPTQGYNLADGTTLFEVCFTVIGEVDTVDVILSNHPTLIEATTGTSQVIPVITDPGQVVILDNSISKVWPGDTDKNGLVDHFDLLNIGLAYGANGLPRPNARISWQGQFAAPWAQNTNNTQINYRHVDTDGNGIINATDTLALALNYRLFNEQWDGEDGYNKRENLPPAARTSSAPLYVDTYPVEEGTSPVFDIVLGDDENAINTVYGLAFSINYDPLAVVPGSLQMSFQDSWLGQPGEDLLTFYRVDSQNHRVYVAMTRIDGLDISGKGPIAQLLVTIEDVIFRSTDYEIPISIENARVITSLEELVSVVERTSTITVSSTTNTLDPELDQQIRVYPVPTGDVFFLKTPQLRIETLELYNLEGKKLRQWTGLPDHLSVADLPEGTYALRLITEHGVAVRRIVVIR